MTTDVDAMARECVIALKCDSSQHPTLADDEHVFEQAIATALRERDAEWQAKLDDLLAEVERLRGAYQSLPLPVISDHCPPHVPGYEWDCQCARCGSSCDYQHCDNCDEGYSHHDCGEDCCCCACPEPNVTCDVCRGRGGWHCCLSSSGYCEANPLEGRADVPRGKIEWFAVREQP